jgi:hypothetical protein
MWFPLLDVPWDNDKDYNDKQCQELISADLSLDVNCLFCRFYVKDNNSCRLGTTFSDSTRGVCVHLRTD